MSDDTRVIEVHLEREVWCSRTILVQAPADAPLDHVRECLEEVTSTWPDDAFGLSLYGSTRTEIRFQGERTDVAEDDLDLVLEPELFAPDPPIEPPTSGLDVAGRPVAVNGHLVVRLDAGVAIQPLPAGRPPWRDDVAADQVLPYLCPADSVEWSTAVGLSGEEAELVPVHGPVGIGGEGAWRHPTEGWEAWVNPAYAHLLQGADRVTAGQVLGWPLRAWRDGEIVAAVMRVDPTAYEALARMRRRTG